MSTLFKQFQGLVARPSLQVGTITAVDVDGGVVTVELYGGGVLQARGVAEIGADVYVRAGLVESTAPTLPTDLIEV